MKEKPEIYTPEGHLAGREDDNSLFRILGKKRKTAVIVGTPYDLSYLYCDKTGFATSDEIAVLRMAAEKAGVVFQDSITVLDNRGMVKEIPEGKIGFRVQTADENAAQEFFSIIQDSFEF